MKLRHSRGTGTWVVPGSTNAAAMTQGTAQVIVVNDGTHNILVGRDVEPRCVAIRRALIQGSSSITRQAIVPRSLRRPAAE